MENSKAITNNGVTIDGAANHPAIKQLARHLIKKAVEIDPKKKHEAAVQHTGDNCEHAYSVWLSDVRLAQRLTNDEAQAVARLVNRRRAPKYDDRSVWSRVWRKQSRFQPYRPYWSRLPHCLNGFRHLHKDSQGVADGTSGQDFYVFELTNADHVREILESYDCFPDGLQINSMYDCTGQEFRSPADIRVQGGRTYVTQLWGYDV